MQFNKFKEVVIVKVGVDHSKGKRCACVRGEKEEERERERNI